MQIIDANEILTTKNGSFGLQIVISAIANDKMATNLALMEAASFYGAGRNKR